ncbi:MAG TPA: PP2C family protein-serine/threonine phosphatase [Patescibacteria group bacterium]|nr:PP2C family protein-serine/threonine phosphatase [Patescibacteria group bacterium]
MSQIELQSKPVVSPAQADYLQSEAQFGAKVEDIVASRVKELHWYERPFTYDLTPFIRGDVVAELRREQRQQFAQSPIVADAALVMQTAERTNYAALQQNSTLQVADRNNARDLANAVANTFRKREQFATYAIAGALTAAGIVAPPIGAGLVVAHRAAKSIGDMHEAHRKAEEAVEIARLQLQATGRGEKYMHWLQRIKANVAAVNAYKPRNVKEVIQKGFSYVGALASPLSQEAAVATAGAKGHKRLKDVQEDIEASNQLLLEGSDSQRIRLYEEIDQRIQRGYYRDESMLPELVEKRKQLAQEIGDVNQATLNQIALEVSQQLDDRAREDAKWQARFARNRTIVRGVLSASGLIAATATAAELLSQTVHAASLAVDHAEHITSLATHDAVSATELHAEQLTAQPVDYTSVLKKVETDLSHTQITVDQNQADWQTGRDNWSQTQGYHDWGENTKGNAWIYYDHTKGYQKAIVVEGNNEQFNPNSNELVTVIENGKSAKMSQKELAQLILGSNDHKTLDVTKSAFGRASEMTDQHELYLDGENVHIVYNRDGTIQSMELIDHISGLSAHGEVGNHLSQVTVDTANNTSGVITHPTGTQTPTPNPSPTPSSTENSTPVPTNTAKPNPTLTQTSTTKHSGTPPTNPLPSDGDCGSTIAGECKNGGLLGVGIALGTLALITVTWVGYHFYEKNRIKRIRIGNQPVSGGSNNPSIDATVNPPTSSEDEEDKKGKISSSTSVTPAVVRSQSANRNVFKSALELALHGGEEALMLIGRGGVAVIDGVRERGESRRAIDDLAGTFGFHPKLKQHREFWKEILEDINFLTSDIHGNGGAYTTRENLVNFLTFNEESPFSEEYNRIHQLNNILDEDVVRELFDELLQSESERETLAQWLKNRENKLSDDSQSNPLLLRKIDEIHDKKSAKPDSPILDGSALVEVEDPDAVFNPAGSDGKIKVEASIHYEKLPITGVGIAHGQGPKKPGTEEYVRERNEDNQIYIEEFGGRKDSVYLLTVDAHSGHQNAGITIARDLTLLHPKMLLDNLKKGEPEGRAMYNSFEDAENMLEAMEDFSIPHGATAVAVLIQGNNLFTGNVGDSRAILVDGNNRAVQLTVDHDVESEMKRDRKLKEYVSEDTSRGKRLAYQDRSAGVNVARAFGDRMTFPGSSVVPDVRYIILQPQHKRLIIASDGLWNTMKRELLRKKALRNLIPLLSRRYTVSHDEVNQYVANIISNIKDPRDAARFLYQRAIDEYDYFNNNYRSRNLAGDNLTIQVVDLLVESEEERQKKLRAKIEEEDRLLRTRRT